MVSVVSGLTTCCLDSGVVVWGTGAGVVGLGGGAGGEEEEEVMRLGSDVVDIVSLGSGLGCAAAGARGEVIVLHPPGRGVTRREFGVTQLHLAPEKLVGMRLAMSGEDGYLSLVNLEKEGQTSGSGVEFREFVDVELHASTFLNLDVLLAVGSHISIVDVRASAGVSQTISKLTGARSVANHTSSPEYFVTGSRAWEAQEGLAASVLLWDIRRNSATPVCELHQGDVDEIIFHPANRGIVFSASQDGTVYQTNIFDSSPSSIPLLSKNFAIHSLDACVDPASGDVTLCIGADDESITLLDVPSS